MFKQIKYHWLGLNVLSHFLLTCRLANVISNNFW